MLMDREQTPDVVQDKVNLVVFLLNQIHYAIAIQPIQQIIEMVTITPVLKTESWMEGVINYHGFSIPVINLRRHFNMKVLPYGWHTPIILVNIANHQVGLIVDDVLDVLTLPVEQVVDPRMVLPPGTPETPLLQGIIQDDERITLLIDLAHLFDQVQVRALNAATSSLSGTLLEPPTAPLKTVKKKRGGTSAKKTEKASAATPPQTTDAESA